MSEVVTAVPRLAPRARDANKGSFGRVLVIAGCARMPGAAILATQGALRGGAGLVTLASTTHAIDRVAAVATSATFLACASTATGSLAVPALDAILEAASACDVAVLGPGLSLDAATQKLARRLVAALEIPLVIDADGLNALARQPDPIAARRAPTIVTPHPGELVRFDGAAIPREPVERRARAEALAARLRAVVCLKGKGTVVTDGARTFVNDTGNPGMATGGTGDVLAGIAGAMLAQHDSPWAAAAFAVRLHGLAGDLAAARRSEPAMIASDLLDSLGDAFRAME